METKSYIFPMVVFSVPTTTHVKKLFAVFHRVRHTATHTVVEIAQTFHLLQNIVVLKMKFILFFIFITVTLASVSPKPPTSKLIQQKWERKVGKGKTETFRQEPSITAKEEKKVSLNAFEICLCGAFATAFGDFCLHPLGE